MSILYIDGSMGAAGDMLTAALLHTMKSEERAEALKELNAMGVPGTEFRAEEAVKCGITGLSMRVLINGEEEGAAHAHEHAHHHEHEHDHDHEHAHDHDHHHDHGCEHHHDHMHDYEHDHHHDHDHEHHHDHNHDHGAHPHVHHGMREISDIVEHLQIPSSVRERVLQVYRLIADAESRVHGVPVTEIHFHEVGALDAVADIAAVMMLLHRINPDEVIVSPLCVGSGTVRCAHGILPVPAPATALLLEGMPFYSDERRGELLTPTGAAVLKTIATSFGSMPVMTGSSFGYGMGKKDFPWANCVRIVSGERCEAAGTAAAVSAETGKQTAPGEVLELSCNLDDVTAEQIGYALGKIFEEGALDAWTVPIGMKKSRPGTMLQVLCREEDREKIMQCLFRETTTLGIREAKYIRRTLERHLEYVDTPDMKVRVKVSEGYGVRREKAEYDDLAELARREDLTFAEAAELIARIRAGRIC